METRRLAVSPRTLTLRLGEADAAVVAKLMAVTNEGVGLVDCIA